jgi:hypothetical protein
VLGGFVGLLALDRAALPFVESEALCEHEMTRRSIFALVGIGFVVGGAAGVVAQRAGLIGGFVRACQALAASQAGKIARIDPPSGRKVFTLIAFGQSNAASHGEPRGRAGAGTYALSSDGFYPCEDPLPGASGVGGSVWTRWAALRRDSHPEEGVVVGCVAQGSSRVDDWIRGGIHGGRIAEVIRCAKAAGLEPSAIVWHQGETESWMPAADGDAYAANLRKVISEVRSLGVTAPIFVCLATRDAHGTVNETIRRAQASVWDGKEMVFAGVDTDSLGQEFRTDNVHFNERGLLRFAELLQRAISARSDRAAVE